MTQSISRPIAPPATSPRLLYVDNLRTALMALVVIHHSVIAYVDDVPLWYYLEPRTDASEGLLDVILVLNQSFFMGAFFLVSALFVPGSYDRKGPGPFLKERLMRLGVPLLLWLLVIRAPAYLFIYTLVRDKAAEEGTELSYWQFYLRSFEPGPMWFVEVLLVFSVLYIVWRRLTGNGRHTADPTPATSRPPGALAIIAFGLGLAIVTYLWRIVMPIGASLLGLPSPAYLPQYISLFVIGLIAARRGWLSGLSRTTGRIGFAAAAVGAITTFFVLATAGDTFKGGGTPASLIATLSESALAVGLILGLLVLFRERLNHQGRLARFLSAHAFTVYVIHPILLVALGYALRGVEAPALAKAALLSAVAIPACWAVAYLVRSVPGARKVL